MEALRSIGAVLRWLVRTTVTFIVALLLVRAIVEFIPVVGTLPPVRALLRWWDPILENVARSAGMNWSHDVRSLVLPAVAIGILVIRSLIDDAIDRALRPKPKPRPKAEAAVPAAAAVLPPVPAPAMAASPPAVPGGQTTIITPAAPASVMGTNFLGSSNPGAGTGPAAMPTRIGRYDIIEELGHGAMGVVYKATDPRIGRTVAIKTISAAGAGGEDLEQYRERFLVEAKSAGRLNHPGVVSVYDVTDDAAGKPCLVLEFVEGTTLDRIMSKEALPLSRSLDIVGQIARALDYAHAHGIVHRDVKPANIMITASGQAKLSDFGIAKMDGTTMTIAGQILGTPAFMSPEQCQGAPLDRRSDIFSLGTVLYMLATGIKPFAGDTFTAVAYKVVHTHHAPASQVNDKLPREIDGILEKALAKDVAQRYATAADFANELEILKAGLAIGN